MSDDTGGIFKEKSFEIDGHDYKATMLGALAGRRLWLKLLHVLAGPLKELASHGTLDQKAGVGAIASLLDALDEGTAEELYEVFGKSCRVRNGERWPQLEGVVFDTHFAGRYVAMTKWLGEMIAFNFASFLGDMSLGSITALMAKATAKAGTASTSPKDSTGTSGAS